MSDWWAAFIACGGYLAAFLFLLWVAHKWT